MPSHRQTFFTRQDEANLTLALKERFPSIRFVDPISDSRKEIHYIDGIEFGTSDEVKLFIPPKSWRPRFRKLEYSPEKYGVANYPEEWMRFHRSREYSLEGMPPMMSQGYIQVGRSNVMTPVEKTLRNKVWQIMSKISTPRLKARADWQGGKPWVEIDCAGWDAVRWALEDEHRVFRSHIYFRPADGILPR